MAQWSVLDDKGLTMPLSRAVLLLQNGQAAQALQALREAPPPHDAHHAFLLGACTHAVGDIPQAVRHFTDALMQEPAHAQAACALGSLYAGLGRRADAEMLFRRTLKRVDDPQLRFNLAVVLEDSGRPADALAEYSQILCQHPYHYATLHNRAGLYAREKRLNEAATDYRLLVREHPAETLPWHNLGELELALGHYEEAARLLAEVLVREPDNGKARLSLAIAHAASGDMVESRAQLAELKNRAPEVWESARTLLNNRYGHDTGIDPRLVFLVREQDHLSIGHWRYWEIYETLFKDMARQPSEGELLPLAFATLSSPLDAREQLGLMRKIAEQVGRGVTPLPPVSSCSLAGGVSVEGRGIVAQAGSFSSNATATVTSKLRIGYAAPNWGHHVTGILFRQLVAAHDADVDVFLISLQAPDNSDNLARLRAQPHLHFVDVSALDDEAAALAIRDLALDVLVDLAVFNDENRPTLLARRPAPVQVSWQAAAYSSGAPWLDYVISDAVVRPQDNWCSEAEVLMPTCFFGFSHEATPPVAPPRRTLGLPEDKFVFACLNHPKKISPALFRRWMTLLKQAPDSVLWLLVNDMAGIFNLKREAEWQEVDPRRLLFAQRVPPEAHLARLAAADLFLDTAPFNGHTTLAECLWAGTPAISQPGNTFASRVGASLLQAAGLPELVTTSSEAYDALALHLYQEPQTLAALRERLAVNRLQVAWADVQGQARHLENAFRHMKARHQQGLPPAPFVVADLS